MRSLDLLFASLVASALVACGDSSTGTAPSPSTDADGGPSTTTVDPRAADRAASIFANLDFEELAPDGSPAGWTCACGASTVACKVDGAASHGAHALVLPSGCVAMQTIKTFDATKALRFDYLAYGGHQYRPDFQIFARAPGGILESAHAAIDLPDSKTYTPVAGETPLRTDGAATLTLYILNSNGLLDASVGIAARAPDLHVDDIVAVQDAPNPAPETGSLVFAQHLDRIRVAAGSATGSIFTPLPIDYASQVPLDVELTVDPPSAASSITYVQEEENNWGALVQFAPGTAESDVHLAWKAVALVRSIPHADRGSIYTKVGDPSAWTQPSAIAQSDYAPLATLAEGLAPASATPEQKMTAVIDWTSAHLGDGTGPMTGLDAKTVFDDHVASCTGYANTAMAMGRALGVPTRHVSNLLVGTSQDMHSIDEFWLGEQSGWRRVEPQGTWAFLPDDYGLVVRLVLPADEVGSTVGIPGIPKNELTEYRDAPSRFSPSTSLPNAFTDCSFCPNRADRQVLLRGTSADVATLFDAARAKWRTTLAALVAGNPSQADLAARRAFVDARSLDDVARALAAIP